MRVVEIIEAKVLRNKRTGKRVSPYGAAPWMTQAEAEDWETVTTGWTWRLDNGTIGLGRVPAKTREEAEEVMARVNGRTNR